MNFRIDVLLYVSNRFRLLQVLTAKKIPMTAQIHLVKMARLAPMGFLPTLVHVHLVGREKIATLT